MPLSTHHMNVTTRAFNIALTENIYDILHFVYYFNSLEIIVLLCL